MISSRSVTMPCSKSAGKPAIENGGRISFSANCLKCEMDSTNTPIMPVENLATIIVVLGFNGSGVKPSRFRKSAITTM